MTQVRTSLVLSHSIRERSWNSYGAYPHIKKNCLKNSCHCVLPHAMMTNLLPAQENHFPIGWKMIFLRFSCLLFRGWVPGCFIDDFYCKYSNSDQLCISFVSVQWVFDSVVHMWNIVGGRSYYSQDTLVLVERFCLEKLLLSSPLQGLLPQKSWISWWETQ